MSHTSSTKVSAKREHKGLKARFRIGSIHGRANYSFNEKAFHRSEVPSHARQAKQEMRALKHGNRLGQNRATWNSSTDTGVPMCQKAANQISRYDHAPYKHNYRAEVLPPKNRNFEPRPSHLEFDRSMLITDSKARDESRLPIQRGKRSQEMPVHPALEGKKLWDNGTNVTFMEYMKQSEASAQKAREYRAQHQFEVVGYLNPVERQRRAHAEMRKKKQAMLNHIGKIPNLTRKDMMQAMKSFGAKAAASAEGGDAPKSGGVYRPYKTTVSRKYKTYKHSGRWEMNKIEGRMMWSDTGSEVKDSKGDIVTVVNPDAWNFASPSHD